MLSLLALGLLSQAPIDSTPPRPISQLVHTRWTTKDGAPSEIRAMAQTSDGYLWLGTLTGLVRFDGVRFVQFEPRGADTVPSGGVRRLLGTRDGSLWIVWRSGGVSRLHNGRVTSYGEPDGLPTAFHLAESGTGVLVAATTKGLALFDGMAWRDAGREWGFSGTEGRALWFDRDDGLWVETPDRVVYRRAGQPFVDRGGPLRIGWAPAEFAQARDGRVWMAELGRSTHTFPEPGDQEPMAEVMVGAMTLVIDRKGSLWVGSAGDGLRRVLDPTRVRGQIAQFGPEAEQFTEKDGLLSDLIYALAEDREGGVWVATSRGLERFRDGPFTPYATPGSVRPRWVYATRDTAVWTAAFGVDELVRIGPRRKDVFDSPYLITILFQDSSGILWTVESDKILRWDGTRFSPIPLRPGTARRLVDITIDRSGTLWVYDEQEGLMHLAADSLVQVAPLYRPAYPHSSLWSDREGRIWVGQLDRVARYHQGKLDLFGVAQGVPTGKINSIYEDRDGRIWVAGEGGLSRFESNRFRKVSDQAGIPGRSVFAIVEDDEGAWWMANQTGVLRLPRGEIERALSDSTYAVRYRRFDMQDGLPGMVTHATWGPAITRTPDGIIWAATDSGVASIDPRNLPLGPAPSVLIEAVRVDGRELAASEAATVPARSSNLEIDYTATSLTAPERVQFRYQLLGEDPVWRDVGTRRRAYYTGLGPGTYQFRVLASNGDGVWNEDGATWHFRVLPAWYQTLWFRAAVVLLIGGIGAASAVQVQRRRHLRAQEALRSKYEATLEERARIAQDLHDTLLQGFAGVTLQLKTAELALPEQPDVAAETILRVQHLARDSLREARERVWDLRQSEPERDDLPVLLETLARQRTTRTGIAVSVATTGQPRRLAHPVEDAAFRIGREAIVNAVRHAKARRLDIRIDYSATRLRLEVQDDGRGFTPAAAEEARRNGHFGLSGARERATRLGGVCQVSSGPEGGTIVAIELPLEQSRKG